MSQTGTYSAARQSRFVSIAGKVSARARRRRYQCYLDVIQPGPQETVVDVGCGSSGLLAFNPEGHVTGVDIVERPGFEEDNRNFVLADARSLPFEDGQFDIAYSNSVIEHINPDGWASYATEVRRVAGRYFVQTPNRYFPLEPHVLLPLFQFLPHWLKVRLWRFGASRGEFEDITLLSRKQLLHLFPDATVIRERFGPLTKSLIAVGPRARVQLKD